MTPRRAILRRPTGYHAVTARVPDAGRGAFTGGLAMARRRDPARILAAQREGSRERLTRTGMLPERVDELLAAFDVLPERQGRPWDGEEAFRWVKAQPRR